MKTETSLHTFGSNRGGHRKAQRRRPRWRKNYQMSASTPCWTDGRNRQTDTGMTVQSLHMQEHLTNAKLRHKRILKLLKKCTQTYEGIISQSYVESMRSFDTSCERLSGFVSAEDNLIILEDKQYDTNLVKRYQHDAHAPDTYKHCTHTHVDHFNKNYSEIIFKSDNETNIGGVRMDPPPYGENVMSCSDSYDRRNMFASPKLRLNQEFSSEYVNEPETPLMDGHRTPFLDEEEDSNHMSFYYDNEFADNHNSRNSDLEAAICNEYASLLDKAGNRLQGLRLDEVQSDISSDFENIFPTSFSAHLSDGSAGLPSLHEENSLELSVPNYTDLTAAPKHDYQLAFPTTVSLCSEGRSLCGAVNTDGVNQTFSTRTANQVPKPPRSKPSLKHVSFSDDALQDSGSSADSESSSAYFDNSTTWLEMKQQYTTWGQIKNKQQTDSPKKSKSVDVLPMRNRARAGSEVSTPDVDTKRYSLTLWEMYKRAHSMSFLDEGELKTPQAYLDPKQSDLKNSIDELLNDVLQPRAKPQTPTPKLKPLPDVSFLLKTKHKLHTFAWWSEIFDQPSFCDRRSAVSETCCGKCERRKSSDHTVIVFQGNGVEQQKGDISFIKEILNPSTCSCREKLSDISSGIATGSSGVTPREPNSWQHIADFLKKRQRNSREVNGCGSLNSTLSDQQLLDVVGCIEAADSLIKCQQSSENRHSELIMRLWKLVSALECILSIGLKSHKLVTVPMGRIRTRVSIWDVVEDSCKSAGEVTDNFQKILNQLSAHKVEDVTVKFCLFVAGLLNSQTLDFWLQLLQYNSSLMDRYYEDDSFLRSKNVGDKKLQCEVTQSLRQLSFHTWDLDYHQIKEAYIPLTNDTVGEPPSLPSKKFVKRSATTPYLQH